MSIILGPARIWLDDHEVEALDVRLEVLTRSELDEQVSTDRIDDDRDYSGWFCVATDPWSCAGEGCDFVANHLTGAHLVICWPERDDPRILSAAHSAKTAGRNPRVVEYEPDFGPCISWDEFDRLGRPVHGKGKPPEGYEPMGRL